MVNNKFKVLRILKKIFIMVSKNEKKVYKWNWALLRKNLQSFKWYISPNCILNKNL